MSSLLCFASKPFTIVGIPFQLPANVTVLIAHVGDLAPVKPFILPDVVPERAVDVDEVERMLTTETNGIVIVNGTRYHVYRPGRFCPNIGLEVGPARNVSVFPCGQTKSAPMAAAHLKSLATKLTAVLEPSVKGIVVVTGKVKLDPVGIALANRAASLDVESAERIRNVMDKLDELGTGVLPPRAGNALLAVNVDMLAFLSNNPGLGAKVLADLVPRTRSLSRPVQEAPAERIHDLVEEFRMQEGRDIEASCPPDAERDAALHIMDLIAEHVLPHVAFSLCPKDARATELPGVMEAVRLVINGCFLNSLAAIVRTLAGVLDTDGADAALAKVCACREVLTLRFEVQVDGLYVYPDGMPADAKATWSREELAALYKVTDMALVALAVSY